MAGGKQTPRQKMINLMYLVFIAMMAMNVSVEVITAFGLMNEKFEKANVTSEQTNTVLLQGLQMRAEDDPTRYSEPYEKALAVQKLSNSFYNYISSLKADATQGFEVDPVTGKLPYEQMVKGAGIDDNWFAGDGYSTKGNEIIAEFKKYRDNFKTIIGNDAKYKFLIDDIEDRMNTNDVKNSDGVDISFLTYHFRGFPAVASLAYLSALQNDVRELEHEAYNLFLGNSLKQAASMKNYQAFVVTDKSVYFAGEPIKGKVVLGRFDKSTVPTSVVINGSAVNTKNIVDGQVVLNMTAGSVGEHKFNGKFTFMEDGKPVVVDVQNSNYVVVPRPNSATIAADKMNVVYVGLDNPISVSFAGVSNDKVNVSSSIGGLTKVGDGKYSLKPLSGREVVVTASGTLPDGKVVSDKKVFRIKPIPTPRGTVRGEYSPKGSIENLGIVNVGVKMEDFDFDVKLNVTEFTVIFPKGSVVVRGGTRLNEDAKRLAQRLKPGDKVIFTNIKSEMIGAPIKMKPAPDVVYTIQ